MKYNALYDLNVYRTDGLSDDFQLNCDGKEILHVKFQTGGTASNLKNGVFIEDLLVFAYAKLKEYNDGFPCRENSLALTKIEEAILWLTARKEEREYRGVYGTEKL